MSDPGTYDVAIIGSGPGGYVGAIRAGQLGLRTAIVERDVLGGVCLNVGCIPAKTLLRHAEVLHLVRRAGEFGITVGDVALDLGQVMARKEQVVRTLREGVQGLLRRNRVDVFQGEGRIARTPERVDRAAGDDAAGEVVVTAAGGDRLSLKARNIVIATGARPRPLPGVAFDGRRIVSTTGALSLPAVPRRFGVVGAGPGGVEFAYVYRLFGAEQVILIEALPRVLPREDADMSRLVEKSLAAYGIRVETGASVTGVHEGEGYIEFKLATAQGNEEVIRVDALLVSIGIEPVTDGLGLDAAGVIRDPRGFVVVDEWLRTSAPGVFAIGDVTPSPPLANVASAEGIAVVERIAGLEVAPLDYERMPRGVYAHPEVGAVGLTEEQARARGYDVRVGRFAYKNNGRALLMGHTEGEAKVVSDARYGEILGVHIVGAEATTMLGEAGAALAFEYTDADLGEVSHAHPTLAEIIQEAALAAAGRALHA